MAQPNQAHTQKHPFHLVDPSPWPIMSSIAVFVLAIGFLTWIHGGKPWLFFGGLGLTLFCMFSWWADVVREATFEGHHTPVVQLGHRYGMALFITSEVMFFAAFFWAFFNASLMPPASIGGVWPPAGVKPLDPWELPLLNTLILLTSGVTVTWAHHALRENNRRGTLIGLALTIILGLTFSCIQAYEYAHASFGFKDGIFSSTFYMATGFHGAHVIIGTIFLAVCFVRTAKGHFKPDHHFGFEAAAWYWHFVDVVWLFLFTAVYWWGGHGAHG